MFKSSGIIAGIKAITMGKKHKKLHLFTEFLGVLAGVALIYFSTQVQDPISYYLFLMGIVTIIIDGWFLTTWG